MRKLVNTDRLVEILVLSAALVSTIAAPALAETEECRSGEFVVTVSGIGSKREKALDTVEDAAPAARVLEAGERAALIAAEDAEDLCDSIAARRRAILRENRDTGANRIARRVPCGCNAIIRAAAPAANDGYYAYQWGLHQTNDIDIDAPEAWSITKGSPSVVVAVIDSGVDFDHRDLAANMWKNEGEVAGNGVDDDGNGYIDDYHGFDAIAGGEPRDENGHGTHVAGTIGARTNNLEGVAGVSWEVSIMPVRFLGANGSGTLYDAIEAIDYVTTMKQRGVNVVLSNNSWGGGPFVQPLYDAIQRAEQAGILFVAAAGNSGSNNDGVPQYPSSYDVANVISVAAIDSSGNLASFSNYGAASVDIGAPGVGIASSVPGGSYAYKSGTSMAAPHVSGALALLAASEPGLGAAAMKDRLFSSVVPLASLSSAVSTGGMLNAYRMLAGESNPPADPTATPTPPSGTPTPLPTATATPTPIPTVAPGVHSISGSVRRNGVGLSGLRVSLTLENGTTLYRYTSPSGEYRFDAIDTPVSYSLSVDAAGYFFSPRSGYLIADTVLNFDGSPLAYTVSGLAVTRSQVPLAGVEIDAGGFGRSFTDSAGRFTISVPFGEAYVLTASHAAYDFEEPIRSGTVYGDVERIFIAKID